MSDPSLIQDPAAAAAAAAAAEAGAKVFREMTIEGFTLYGIAVIFTMLRTYARLSSVGIKGLQGDDYLAWVAVIFYSTQSTLAYFIGKAANGLANNGMTDEQRAALDPLSPEYSMRVIGSQIQVAGWTAYSCLMLSIKLSMLVFYIRLTQGLGRRYRIRIYIGFALVLTTYLASILTIYAACQPFYHYWQISPDPGNVCQAGISGPIIWSSFLANIFTDIYLIFIPVPLLWESTLTLPKKIASTIVLGSGIFVLVCAMLKSIFVILDPVAGGQLSAQWGTRETFVAIVTANLPMILPLFRQWFKPLMPSRLRSTQKAYRTPPGFRSIGGGGSKGPGVDSNRKRGPRSKDSNPMTDLSFTESEERMVNDIKMQNMKIYAEPVTERPQHGIVVSNEFDVTTHQRRQKDMV